MGSGSSFSVNTIVTTSATNANEFYFAGKTKSLTDGAITKTFPSEVGFVMKALVINQDETCFRFTSGYSLSLQDACTINLLNLGWVFCDAGGSYTLIGYLSLPSSSYNILDSKSTDLTTH